MVKSEMAKQKLNQRLPLFAVLRGLEPERAIDVAGVIVSAGFEILEVTMNSPDPIYSIAAIAEAVGDDALVGAGTVTSPQQIDSVVAAGGRLIVSPHCAPELITYAARQHLTVLPGVLTPSDMFKAIDAGATGLKLFPGELVPPSGVRALKATLPPEVPVFVVGGIHAGNMGEYLAAGAMGFGVGGALFKRGKPLMEIEKDAAALVAAFRDARAAAGS
jgi:2-dehydro-3-deoxyphosphogalactonate aldolase